MSTIGCPGFTSIEENGKDRCLELINFGKYSLTSCTYQSLCLGLPKELLTLAMRCVISTSMVNEFQV